MSTERICSHSAESSEKKNFPQVSQRENCRPRRRASIRSTKTILLISVISWYSQISFLLLILSSLNSSGCAFSTRLKAFVIGRTSISLMMVITVREIKTVAGYLLDGTPKQVEIKSSDVHDLTLFNSSFFSVFFCLTSSGQELPL